MLRDILLAAVCLCGHAIAQEFDLPGILSSHVDVDPFLAEVRREGKPGVVFVTQPWCGACKNLKKSINGSPELKTLLGQFVVAHASGNDGTQWQGGEGKSDGYIPRVYFFNPDGSRHEVDAPNPDYEFFFPSSAAVEKGLKQVLASVTDGSGEL